jgi:hypothetical protein
MKINKIVQYPKKIEIFLNDETIIIEKQDKNPNIMKKQKCKMMGYQITVINKNIDK